MKNLYLILISSLILSCNSERLSGQYIYSDPNKYDIFKDAYKYGKSLGCGNSIGIVEFKDDKCYYGSDLGIAVKYYIEDGVGYIKSDQKSNISLKLFEVIDENSISFFGCLFKKIDFNSTKVLFTSNDVNIRSGPGTDYDVLKTLNINSKVLLLEKGEEWSKINSFFKEGYIHNSFLIENETKPEMKPNNQKEKETTPEYPIDKRALFGSKYKSN